MFYIILFICVLGFLIFNQTFWNRKLDKSLSVLFVMTLIVLGTIRWKTGFDWGAYQSFYIYVRDYVDSWQDLKISFEPIFTSFYFLAKYSGIGFVLVQFLQITIILLCKYYVFKRYTPYIFLALFLNFCFFPDIVTVRNFLAASVVLISLKFVEERKVIPFILVILIAANIHFSSIVSLLFYPLFHKNFSIGVKSFAILFSVLLGYSGVFEIILSPFVGVLGGEAGGKLSYYVNASESGAATEKGAASVVLGLLRRLLILPVILFFEAKYFKNDKRFKGISNLFIFGNVLYFLVGNGSLMIFQRMSIPFYLCEVILLVYIYSKLKVKTFFLAFLVLYGFTKYYYIYDSAVTVQPYINIFNYKEKEAVYWEKYKPRGPEFFK